MAKRPTQRAEAREIATVSKPASTTRESTEATSSTAIDIDRERKEPLDSGSGAEARSAKAAMAISAPNEDDIRRRAYQRYLERGNSPGSDFDDWLAAERELKHGL